MELLPADLAGEAAQLGLRISRIAARTDKSVLAAGVLAGQRVAVKWLLSTDPYWAARFRHEVDVYRVFASSQPPVTVPRLIYADNARVLVTEWLDGHRLDDDRYPQRALDTGELSEVLRAVTTLNRWQPPAGAFGTTLDYPARFRRYQQDGYLSDADHAALTHRLSRASPPREFNHGDALPSNFVLRRDPADRATAA